MPSGSEEDKLIVNFCPTFFVPEIENLDVPPLTGGGPVNPSSSKS